LYAQSPHVLKKHFATQSGIDLKFTTEEGRTQKVVLMKLQIVVQFIREHESLGAVDAPGQFVEDTLVMRGFGGACL